MSYTATQHGRHLLIHNTSLPRNPRIGQDSAYKATKALGRPTWRHIAGPDVGPRILAELGFTPATAAQTLLGEAAAQAHGPMTDPA